MVTKQFLVRAIALTFVFVNCAISTAYAAACCSSGSALPALITSDDQSLLGLTVTAEKTVGDVNSRGESIFRGRGDSEWNQVLQLSGAYLVKDRLQFGMVLPLARRTRQYGVVANAQDIGLGDLRTLVSYEAVPDWSYSPWRPKVFIFGGLTIPLGRSIYNAQKTYAVDAHGRGFFVPAIGAIALKSWDIGWSDFGVSLSTEMGRVLGRTFATQDSVTDSLKVGGAWSVSGTGAVSLAMGDWTLGSSLAITTEGPKSILTQDISDSEAQSAVTSQSARSRVWTVGSSFSFLLSREWMMRLSYQDQTLMGPVQNSALLRSASVALTWLNPR